MSKPASTHFDRAAATYGQVGPDFFSELADLLVRHAQVGSGWTVLDIGAGTGAVTKAVLAAFPTCRGVIATDLSSRMLGQLRDPLRVIGAEARTIAVMDAASLSLAPGSVDAVLSGIALQSIHQPKTAVSEICRVLRPGGSFAFSIATGWWWQEDFRWRWHADLLQDLEIEIEEEGPSSVDAFVDRLLTDRPLGGLRRRSVVLPFDVADAHTYWEWCWSHGWRRIMELMTPAQLNGYRQGIDARFEEGPLLGELAAKLVYATRL